MKELTLEEIKKLLKELESNDGKLTKDGVQRIEELKKLEEKLKKIVKNDSN